MKKRKLIAPIAVSVVLAGGVIGYMQLNSAANGTLTKVATDADKPIQDDRIAVDNDYASFSYPTKFTSNPIDPPVAPMLASYSFTKQQIGSWQVGIQITKLENSLLTNDSTYNYRNVTTSRYKKTQQKVGEHTVTIFTDISDATFAKTAYLQKGDIAAIISVMGGTASSYNQLQTDFDALIASWRWQ